MDLSFLEYQYPMSIGLSSELFCHVINELELYGSTMLLVMFNKAALLLINSLVHMSSHSFREKFENTVAYGGGPALVNVEASTGTPCNGGLLP